MQSNPPSRYSLLVKDVLCLHQSTYTKTRLKIISPIDTYKICADILDAAQEMFQVLTINARGYVIDRHLATLGLSDCSLVNPSIVFRHAIQDSAHSLIMVHNHPSGDPTPSAEDIRVTRQLIAASQIIDIKLLDHVVIGRSEQEGGINFISMREEGLVNFV